MRITIPRVDCGDVAAPRQEVQGVTATRQTAELPAWPGGPRSPRLKAELAIGVQLRRWAGASETIRPRHSDTRRGSRESHSALQVANGGLTGQTRPAFVHRLAVLP